MRTQRLQKTGDQRLVKDVKKSTIFFLCIQDWKVSKIFINQQLRINTHRRQQELHKDVPGNLVVCQLGPWQNAVHQQGNHYNTTCRVLMKAQSIYQVTRHLIVQG